MVEVTAARAVGLCKVVVRVDALMMGVLALAFEVVVPATVTV